MLVSIVMPAYNAEKYIEESIQTVLNQTWKDWELFVVNDCSSDHTSLIVQTYAAQDSRICLLNNVQNLGVADSRNIGVKNAHGEWVAFLDSDDLWTPDKLSLQIELIKRTGALFAFTGSAFIGEDGDKLTYQLHVPEQIGYRELLKQNLISCSSVLIQKELLLSHPMKGKNVHEDFVVWLTILRDLDMNAYGIDKPALIYRLHSHSKSAKKWKAAIMNWNVYRNISLSFPACCYYQLCYSIRGIKKYRNIKEK